MLTGVGIFLVMQMPKRIQAMEEQRKYDAEFYQFAELFSEIYGQVKSGTTWFDTTRFSAPANGTFGNVGRNVLTGPDLVNVDFSLFRKFRIKERGSLELRAEWFNLSNTPHFNNPSANISASNFLVVTAAQPDQQQLRLGLRLSW